MTQDRVSQRGAALIIVLVLLVTMSFLVLTITEGMTLATQRAVNARARAEAMWRAIGVEALAASALSTALKENPRRMRLDDPWVERPFEAPMEGGVATLWFSDATRCVNLNALVVSEGDGTFAESEKGRAELVAVLTNAGANSSDVQRVADVIADWIDTDTLAGSSGAEDSHYTALPSPYRTGGTLLADVSEIRAMADIGAELVRSLDRYICVHPSIDPSPVNVNMLRPEDAPVLVGALGGRIDAVDAAEIIASRPPGGYDAPQAFLSHPKLAGLELGESVTNRLKTASRYIEARAKIAYQGAVINATLVFEVDDSGKARLVSRRWSSA